MDLQEEESSETREVYQCVFCSSLFNGQCILLDCLHFICNNCLINVRDIGDSGGIQCKCKHVTENDSFSEVPVSSEFCQNLKCFENTCNDLATKICICCQYLFCGPCSIKHLEKLTNHVPIIKKKGFIPCHACKKASIHIYCENCSVMICEYCHVKDHRTHKFRLIQLIAQEVVSDLISCQHELKLNNTYFERCLKETQEHAQLLENKRKLAKIQVDKTMLLLHEQINQRSFELKKEIDNCFFDSMKKLDENKDVILESKKKNLYYDKLISTVCNQNQIINIVRISEPLKNKLEIAKVNLLNTPIDLQSFQTCLEFSSEGTLISSLLAIKAVGSIKFSMILRPGKANLPLNQEQSGCSIAQASDCPMDIKPFRNGLNQFDNNSRVNDVDTDNHFVSHTACACCNQWITDTDVSVLCPSCSRTYHNDCHIPILKPNTSLTIQNPCTMCTDLSTYVGRLSKREPTFIHCPMGKSERKILERLLMELYCQNVNSDHFRIVPRFDLYPWFFRKISNPMSLDQVKNFLMTDENYTLHRGIIDIRKIFSNISMVFPRSDPTYIDSQNLQDYFVSLVKKFIPRLILHFGSKRS